MKTQINEAIVYELLAIKAVRDELRAALLANDKLKATEVSQRLTALYCTLEVDVALQLLTKEAA